MTCLGLLWYHSLSLRPRLLRWLLRRRLLLWWLLLLLLLLWLRRLWASLPIRGHSVSSAGRLWPSHGSIHRLRSVKARI